MPLPFIPALVFVTGLGAVAYASFKSKPEKETENGTSQEPRKDRSGDRDRSVQLRELREAEPVETTDNGEQGDPAGEIAGSEGAEVSSESDDVSTEAANVGDSTGSADDNQIQSKESEEINE